MDQNGEGPTGCAQGTSESLNEKLSKAIGAFGAQLGSSRMGTLTQAWVPGPGDDGGVVLNTQGLPFCINGTADLLALFRCISCKYKFSTDTTKPWIMGPVGRVYTSGEPELTQSLQQYDQSVYCRVAEAQRCHVNCCLFLPVYTSAARDRVAAVMEVVQTEDNARFPGLVDWAKVCLEGAGLWTMEADGDDLPMGLRTIKAEYDASAFESKIEARGTALRTATGAFSMPPPPVTLQRQGPAPSNTYSMGSVQPGGELRGMWQQPNAGVMPGAVAMTEEGGAAEADDAAGGSGLMQGLNIAARMQPTSGAVANKDRVVQVGKNLILACDAPAPGGWQMPVSANGVGAGAPNGGLGNSGSGGSSEPVTQHQPSVPMAIGNDLQQGSNGWGLPLQVPQGYATSYGHGDRAITLDDLAPHFNVSLRDAASRMGISVTTLKRACRRLGLHRWPRRELATRAHEASAAAAAAAAAVAQAAAAVGGVPGATDHNIFSWTSGQTISADSTGEALLDPSRAAAGAAAAAPSGAPLLPYQIHHHPQQILRPSFAAQMLPPMMHCQGLSLRSGGGELRSQTRSLESIDILAAADVDTFSVGNSPQDGTLFPAEGATVGCGGPPSKDG